MFAELAHEVVPAGEAIARTDLITRVLAEHEARGGLPPTGVAVAVAKKALRALADEGRAEAATHGYWRFLEPLDPASVDEPVLIGEGPESVYVYYFPAYRDQAAYLQRDTWPMKIGMTRGQVAPRIKDQCGTAMPEAPVVGMIYRTANAANAERVLHSTLRERGRHLADAPGSEWFQTSLDEVRSILDFATGR